MTKELYEQHARMCRVFTAPARLELLNLLRDGEKSVSELAGLTGLNQPNVSQHLAVMRERGLVAARREANTSYYRVTDDRIFIAFDLIREMLLERLEQQGNLAASLASEPSPPPGAPGAVEVAP